MISSFQTNLCIGQTIDIESHCDDILELQRLQLLGSQLKAIVIFIQNIHPCCLLLQIACSINLDPHWKFTAISDHYRLELA